MTEMEDVLSFWLGPEPTTAGDVEARKQFWFGGGEGLDREIRDRFGGLVQQAREGGLDGWSDTPRGTVALIILIDQFSRNIHRGSPDAFSRDGKALGLSRQGYDSRRFADLDRMEHVFAAMPFRHAEDVESQKRAVALTVAEALAAAPHWKDFLVYSVDWARKHLDVIVRFGRFPHRNAALGRPSTPEEREYLEYLKLAGQWL